MILIGLNGSMGVGKSTAVALISGLVGKQAQLVKFAQPLYDMQEFIYKRISLVHKRPADFVKDRKLLQWLGSDWGRDTVSKTLWVDLWKAQVAEIAFKDRDALIVCDDVRFDNEAEVIRALTGRVIQIKTNRVRDVLHGGFTNHQSENGVSSNLLDGTVNNDGTVKQFELALNEVLKLSK